MDPIATARYGLLAASRQFEASASRIASVGGTEGDNVDLAKETVNTVEAKQAFSANISVIKFADEMWNSLLDLQRR